jgi:hypothetical protein
VFWREEKKKRREEKSFFIYSGKWVEEFAGLAVSG